jgi:hypothetical protein
MSASSSNTQASTGPASLSVKRVQSGTALSDIARRDSFNSSSTSPQGSYTPRMASGSSMNGNADMSSETGHIVNQAGASKGDYRMVGISEEDEHPSLKSISASKPGAGLLSVPEVVSHPALSIASYCAASILMTVVNKVRGCQTMLLVCLRH